MSYQYHARKETLKIYIKKKSLFENQRELLLLLLQIN